MCVNNKNKILSLICLLLLLAMPFCGATLINPLELLDSDSYMATIFWQLRLTRTLVAFFAGAGLAVAGLVFQAMLRNPLATPFTLGVSSGAAFGTAIYLNLGLSFSFLGFSGSLLAAILGCVLSMFLVLLITRAKGGLQTSVMLLAGVIINFFFSSLVLFMQYLSDPNDSLKIIYWLMGSLNAIDSVHLADLGFIILASSLCLSRLVLELDLLCLGDEIAASRGVDSQKVKLYLFLLVSLMVAMVTSLAGPIGFVGMMVPHFCRLCYGLKHSILLPACFLCGGTFLAFCDLIARTIIAPAELPIGILTAMLGAPFFLYLLFKSQKNIFI